MDGQLAFGPFVLHRKPQRLTREGVTVDLRNQALKLLDLMADRPGVLITHDEIRENIWADRHVDYSGGVHLLVREIRKALEDDAKAPIYVETVPRQGYRFIGPVESTNSYKTVSSKTGVGRYRLALSGGIALILIIAIAAIQISPFGLTGNVTERSETLKLREAYSKGLYLLEQGDSGSLAKAEAEFSSLIQADTGNAPAHAGLAAIAIRKGQYDAAELHALKARDADPHNADAYFYLGLVFMRRDWNWSEAEANINKAISLEPEKAKFHSIKSMLLTTIGRAKDALKASDTAYNLDPASALITLDHGWAYLYAGEFDRAYEFCEQAVYLNPQKLNGAVCQYKASLRRGNFTDAQNAAAHIASLIEADPVFINAIQGLSPQQSLEKFHDWLRIILDAENADIKIAAADKAVIFAEMNEFEKAFAMISAAAAERSATLPFYLRDPVFKPVASSKQYLEALKVTGLHDG